MSLKIIPLLAAAVFIAFFVRLGYWQLDRAEQKVRLYAGFEKAAENKPLPLAVYAQQPRFTRVSVRGRFTEPEILLDNQPLDGRQGAHLFNGFVVDGGTTLLVNRGWMPLPRDRRSLPPLPPSPGGLVTVTGLLSSWPQPGIKLGEIDYSLPQPWRVPYLEPDALAQRLQTTLAPQVLLATDGAGEGLVSNWRPQVMAPEKHRGYALQWFSLAAAVILVTLIMQWRQYRK